MGYFLFRFFLLNVFKLIKSNEGVDDCFVFFSERYKENELSLESFVMIQGICCPIKMSVLT